MQFVQFLFLLQENGRLGGLGMAGRGYRRVEKVSLLSVFTYHSSYDSASTGQIEEAYKNSVSVVPLSHGFFASSGGYTVDLSRMTQTRDSTGFQRPIRRIPPVLALSASTSTRSPLKVWKKAHPLTSEEEACFWH